MEFKEFRNKLFDKAKREGFSECEVYYVDKESLKVSVYAVSYTHLDVYKRQMLRLSLYDEDFLEFLKADKIPHLELRTRVFIESLER